MYYIQNVDESTQVMLDCGHYLFILSAHLNLALLKVIGVNCTLTKCPSVFKRERERERERVGVS